MKTADELLQVILELDSRKRLINSSLLNGGHIDTAEYFRRAEEDKNILQIMLDLVQRLIEGEELRK